MFYRKARFTSVEDWVLEANRIGADPDIRITEYELHRGTLPILTQDKSMTLTLRTLNQELTCAICLSIIQDTRAVGECLHRFCADCITKCLRIGKKECPTCRTKCSSQRHLRPDPRFDCLIRQLYPDIEAYEKAEDKLVEEINRNHDTSALQKQIEDGIKRQAIANAKNRPRVEKPLPSENAPRRGRPPGRRGRPPGSGSSAPNTNIFGLPKRRPGRPPKNPKPDPTAHLSEEQLKMLSSRVKADSVYHFQHIDQTRIGATLPPPPPQPVTTGLVLFHIYDENFSKAPFLVSIQRTSTVGELSTYLGKQVRGKSLSLHIGEENTADEALPKDTIIHSLQSTRLFYRTK